MNNTDKENQALKILRESIQYDVTIPDSEWDYAAKHFQFLIFTKNLFFVKAGDYLDRVFSICSGLVRYYYITESGKEFNKYFVMDNRFFGSFSSLFHCMPCGFFIQAI